MRHSVEAYDIYDKHGRVLYDGDYVEKCWGGYDGQRILELHRLHIRKSGRLFISGCSNIVLADELVKIDRPKQPLNKRYYRPWVDEP